jgi:hypothetical protein
MHGITGIGITPLYATYFYRMRATNFINLPSKHDCTRLQGFDHRTFRVFFLKFCNSIVERRKLKMQLLDFRVIASKDAASISPK